MSSYSNNNKSYKNNKKSSESWKYTPEKSSDFNQLRTEVFNAINEFPKKHPKNLYLRNSYKTSYCRNKDCYFHEYCYFAHNEEEKRSQICLFHYINRSCNRSNCDCKHSDDIPEEVPILTNKIKKDLYYRSLNDCKNRCLTKHKFDKCICGTFVIELDSEDEYEDEEVEFLPDESKQDLLTSIINDFENCKIDTIEDPIVERVTKNIEIYNYIFENFGIPNEREREIYLDYIKKNGPLPIVKRTVEPQPLPDFVKKNLIEYNKKNPEKQIDIDKFYYNRYFNDWSVLNNCYNFSLFMSLTREPFKSYKQITQN